MQVLYVILHKVVITFKNVWHRGFGGFRNTLLAIFPIRILEDHFWRKGRLEVRQKEHFHRYFPWIQTSRKPWNGLTHDYLNSGTALLQECSFFVVYTLRYFTSLALHEIDVFSLPDVLEVTNAFIWKKFFQSWETEKSGFFSSLATVILSKTCSFLHLRKVCPLINSDLFHMKMGITGAILLIFSEPARFS